MIFLTQNTIPVQGLMMYEDARFKALNRTPFGDSTKRPLLCVDSLKFMPFTIVKTTSGHIEDVLTSVLMYDLDGTLKQDITTLINTTVKVDYSTTTGYIRFFATANLASELPTGFYYLVLTDGTDTWTTEDFKICKLNDSTYPHAYVKVEYYNSGDAFGFIYQNDYKNYFYLDTVIMPSEQRILLNVLEDEDNNQKKTYDARDPQYSLKILSKDYLYNVINNIAQHSTINITDTTGQTYEAENLEVTRENVTNEFYNTLIEFGIKDDERVWRAADGATNNVTLKSQLIVNEDGSGDNITFEDETEWAQ